jgi:hypothetical protein
VKADDKHRARLNRLVLDGFMSVSLVNLHDLMYVVTDLGRGLMKSEGKCD